MAGDREGSGAMLRDDDLEEIDQKDDGYIELVLRVLARMCDGQHMGLQVTNRLLDFGSLERLD